MEFNQLMTAVATGGTGIACTAAVIWFMHHRETKTLPAMMQTFTEAQQAQQLAFANARAEAERVAEARHTKTLDTFALMTREERQTCQKWHEENRADTLRFHEENQKTLARLSDETKDHRHDLRGLAHQLGLKQAIEEERAKFVAREDDTPV